MNAAQQSPAEDLFTPTRELRSEALNPDLVKNRFAVDWVFPIPDSFRSALDILWDVRQEMKVRRSTWTQGKNYCFAVGDSCYDSTHPYTTESWLDAIPQITIGLQITKAQAANAANATEGHVEFIVLRPHEASVALRPTSTYAGTQAEFVTLLRTGCFRGVHHSAL